MTYYNGMMLPIPTGNKEKYLKRAREDWPTFRQFGALRLVELWGEATPETDMGKIRPSVQTHDDETVVFAWIEWPDKATADAAWEKMMTRDQGPEDGGEADWSRMVWGGFELLFDSTQDA